MVLMVNAAVGDVATRVVPSAVHRIRGEFWLRECPLVSTL